jgi:hypothetical protein
MKAATRALRNLLGRLAKSVGMEGTFLLIGTALLAVGSAYLNPAGPWVVVGSVSLILGLATAVPVRRGE